MAKVISIKLTKVGNKSGPFSIYDQRGNLIAENISKSTLISGKSFNVDDSVLYITMKSTGDCSSELTKPVGTITKMEYHNLPLDTSKVGCLWQHYEDQTLYNSFYGTIGPYIIEYPFAYQYKDEIIQNVESADKVYKYYQTYPNSSDRYNRILIDDGWFNKAVVFNDQQSSGILELVPKPISNMKEYMLYPKFNADNKSIIYTKSDSMYQYNTFWSAVRDRTQPLFTLSCESLSIDKIVNQTNMDYSPRAFRKESIRAKDVRIRHILDNRSDINIVTQFIVTPSQISYK